MLSLKTRRTQNQEPLFGYLKAVEAGPAEAEFQPDHFALQPRGFAAGLPGHRDMQAVSGGLAVPAGEAFSPGVEQGGGNLPVRGV